ncbi:MAG: type I DNA topoisomerase [Bacilli bacterium]|nr:type I DNA topoisomerase [Bacilli bacterium]
MKLVIVESPNKIRTINQFLGDNYKVMASVGHVRDLATKGKGGLGVDVDHDFEATYKIIPGKTKIVKEIKNEVKKCDEVYLATDPDREGEAIAWHLAVVLGLDPLKVKRLSFNAITSKEVKKAIENPGHINMDLVASQETRRILDRIIGFDLSGLLKNKIKTKSAGRVQSVTLKMIVEHQKDIDAFVPKEYWDISGEFGQEKIVAPLYSKNNVIYKPNSIDSKDEVDQILKELPKEFNVLPLVFSKRTSSSRPAFTTSSLEQEAYTRFKYSARLTSSIAQRLFEGIEIHGSFKALITYIRTDSTRLAPDFVDVASQYIVDKYGPDSYNGVNLGKKKNLVQDAHEAIRPVDLTFTPAIAKKTLNKEMYNVYRLIYARTIASMMKPKIDNVTTLKFEGNGYIFKTEAVKNEAKGYTAAYEDCGIKMVKAKTVELPDSIIKLAESKGKIVAQKIDTEKKSTNPPDKYNDGSVVRLMEEKGIGRPSTYASTISTLVAREYITSIKHTLNPTDSGKLVVEKLEEFFPDLMSYSYTSEMESDLEKIKDGDSSKQVLLREFYTEFMKQLEIAKKNMEKIKDEETGEMCPVCGSPLVIKHGRYGKFVACSNYPTCNYIKKEKKEIEYVEGRECPKCGHKLVYRTSRRGERFIGCSNYPKCKYTEGLNKPKDDGKSEDKLADMDPDGLVGTTCPKCGKGTLVLKKSRFGVFYGCSNYPKCRYTQKVSTQKKKNEED